MPFDANRAATEGGSKFPVHECIGAGRLDGWFRTPSAQVNNKGWGHIESFCFEGDLFFHLHRSPLLRAVDFIKADAVTFEVVELNGRCEAVKMSLPGQIEDQEATRHGLMEFDKPQPKDLIGQHVQGVMKSNFQVVKAQHWGFVCSDDFAGLVFWHITENPQMNTVEYDRDDIVEFTLALDEKKGNVRAKNMKLIRSVERPFQKKRRMKSEQTLAKAGFEQGRVLPFAHFDDGWTTEMKVELCMGSFEDIHRKVLADSVVSAVQGFVREVNDIFGDDRAAKNKMSSTLAQHAWFAKHGQEVKFQLGKNTITVTSKENAVVQTNWGNQQASGGAKGAGGEAWQDWSGGAWQEPGQSLPSGSGGKGWY